MTRIERMNSGRTRARIHALYAAMLGLLASMPCFADQVRGYGHLNSVMDRYNRSFDVYTDRGAGGNHFVAFCKMASISGVFDLAAVSVDDGWRTGCRRETCIRASLDVPDSLFDSSRPDTSFWGGGYFQNGVLAGDATVPSCNWGEVPDAGFNLSGARSVSFLIRGEVGGERVELFAGGVGRGFPAAPFPDSFDRVPRAGIALRLTRDWRRVTIRLRGRDLSYVNGGLGWVASVLENCRDGSFDGCRASLPAGCETRDTGACRPQIVFYLDDIRYDLARVDEPRMLNSYDTLPGPEAGFDDQHRNVAFLYDNAVVMLAYLARGRLDDLRRAALIADAIVLAQAHDRTYSDGRLRNAYQSGDLQVPPGWTPNDREDTVRLPGRWQTDLERWFEDDRQVSSDTGNMAWAMIALMRAYNDLKDNPLYAARAPSYLAAAKALGEWVENEARDEHGAGGYTGGYVGNDGVAVKQTWKAVEHNLDLTVAFHQLADASTGDEQAAWRTRALYAKGFVESMWGACGPMHFAAGTLEDGVMPNCDVAPEDVNTWALLALGKVETYGPALTRVLTSARTTEPCGRRDAEGIAFSELRSGVWFEGTAHAVLAALQVGDRAAAKELLRELRRAQRFAPEADGRGMVAACRDGVETGLAGFELYNRRHIAATAWYVMAERGYNPFWGTRAGEPVPHEGE